MHRVTGYVRQASLPATKRVEVARARRARPRIARRKPGAMRRPHHPCRRRPRGSRGAPCHVVRRGAPRRGGTDRDPATGEQRRSNGVLERVSGPLRHEGLRALALAPSRASTGSSAPSDALYKLGGEHRFTGDLNALSGKTYDWERYLRISNIVARAHKLGMKMYLGFYFANTLQRPDAARRVVRRHRLVADRAPGDQGHRRGRQGARVRRSGRRSGALPAAGRPLHRDVGLELRRQHAHRGAGSGTGEGPRAADHGRRSSQASRRWRSSPTAASSPTRGTSSCRRRSTETTPPTATIVYIDLWDGMTTPDGYDVDPVPQRDLLQDSPHHRRDLGHGVHVRVQPFLRDALAATVELGGRRRQGLRDAVRLDQQRFDRLRGAPTTRPTSPISSRRRGDGAWSARSPTTPTTT